ncbi:glycosyltransferase family 4 protein [Psychrobacter faecalis]|uniref:glycosyltransferase family 4 protein n=1 Tax=Psychrobacter faecalis TaxID=180588 RepID=UPI0028A806BF|nr:glycosyltransferase family 4 protein [Psychrobacter faecalis]
MKIIYLHQYFNTPNMSGGTRSYEMAKRLVESGHEVHMITSWTKDTNQDDWFYELIDGIHVHWLPNTYNNKMSFKRRLMAFSKFAIAATRKAISIKESDIIFATSTPLTIAIPGIIASKVKKTPMVFEVRDLWPEVPIAMGVLNKPYQIYLAKLLEKWAYSNSEHVIALSPGMKEGVIQSGYPNHKVTVIPNSSDNSLFEVSDAEYDNFITDNKWLPAGKSLIYTGTFGIVNNVIIAVDIAAELKERNSDISIVLVGDGIQYDEIVDYAEKKSVLNESVFVKKQVPKHEIPFYLKYASIASSFAIDLPAIQANSANKFFDALAASKPILINYGGWQKDIIENNQCGVVVWKKTVPEIVDELESFLYDEKIYEQACINSKRLALNEFSRDNLAKKLQIVLLDACKK